jgi:hypothetical protein
MGSSNATGLYATTDGMSSSGNLYSTGTVGTFPPLSENLYSTGTFSVLSVTLYSIGIPLKPRRETVAAEFKMAVVLC